MTFEEFLESRRWCDDLGAPLGVDTWKGDPAPGRGYLYADHLDIQQVQAFWPQDVKRRGSWYLVLGNEDRIGGLAEPEHRLHAYAGREGAL